MPDSYDPDSFSLNTIKETIRTHNNFTKRKIRKFRQHPELVAPGCTLED
jgi:hypothetical protein